MRAGRPATITPVSRFPQYLAPQDGRPRDDGERGNALRGRPNVSWRRMIGGRPSSPPPRHFPKLASAPSRVAGATRPPAISLLLATGTTERQRGPWLPPNQSFKVRGPPKSRPVWEGAAAFPGRRPPIRSHLSFHLMARPPERAVS
jgi:hypothetical protein